MFCFAQRVVPIFQWGGWFFTSNTLPFGWKSSAYIYHSIGLFASHYFRSVLIPCLLYIDDRHTGKIQLSIKAPAYAPLSSQREKSLARASSAIFIVCHTLISLGYFLGLKKSILTPKQVVPYLGFLIDSVRQAFLLIQEKKQKCLSLTRHVLSCSSTDVKILQRLSGKYMSFALAVPGARFFINELNIAIAKGLPSSRPISVSGSLKDEIQHWLFLESWTGYLPWRQELHHQVRLCSDASSFAWPCTLGPNAHGAMIRDYWPADQRGLHINVKEILALVNALEALSFRDSWVDVLLIAKFSLGLGSLRVQSHMPFLTLLRSCFGLSQKLIFISTFLFPPVIFPLLLILRIPLREVCLCRMPSYPRLPGRRFRRSLGPAWSLCRFDGFAVKCTTLFGWLPTSFLFSIPNSWLFWGQCFCSASS